MIGSVFICFAEKKMFTQCIDVDIKSLKSFFSKASDEIKYLDAQDNLIDRLT